jgi:hypothetical protein
MVEHCWHKKNIPLLWSRRHGCKSASPQVHPWKPVRASHCMKAMPWEMEMLHGRKLQTGAKLHVALYFQTLRIYILKFKRIRNEILEIANDVYYNGVKSQYKPLYILGYTKITNSYKFYSE